MVSPSRNIPCHLGCFSARSIGGTKFQSGLFRSDVQNISTVTVVVLKRCVDLKARGASLNI